MNPVYASMQDMLVGAPDSLKLEIAGGYWHVLPADSKAIFHTNPTECWREFLERSSVIHG